MVPSTFCFSSSISSRNWKAGCGSGCDSISSSWRCGLLFCLTCIPSPGFHWCLTCSARRIQDQGGKTHYPNPTLRGTIHQHGDGLKPAASFLFFSCSPSPFSLVWGPGCSFPQVWGKWLLLQVNFEGRLGPTCHGVTLRSDSYKEREDISVWIL